MRINLRALVTLVIFTGSVPASADLLQFSMDDEISGESDHFVIVKAEDWDHISWENELVFACYRSGDVSVRWHHGGTHSGWYDEPHEAITAKFDTDEPVDMTLRSLAHPPFIDRMRSASVLIARPPSGGSTSRFRLNGTSKAFSIFKTQCGV